MNGLHLPLPGWYIVIEIVAKRSKKAFASNIKYSVKFLLIKLRMIMLHQFQKRRLKVCNCHKISLDISLSVLNMSYDM